MNDSTVEIIQPTEQHVSDLHQKVSQQLNQAGHQATPQSVNPDDNSPLKSIQEAVGDTTHVVGSTFEELVRGSDTSHVRTATGKVPISITAGKWARKILMKGQKAA